MKTVDEEAFEAEVLKADRPVLCDFYADWCQPCKLLAPTFEKLAKEYDGRVKFVKVDIEASQKLTAQYKINSIPALVLFQNGEATDHMVGLVSKAKVRGVLEDVLFYRRY